MRAVNRVLIVGGGIAGVTLTRALVRLGLEVEVIERNPSWEVVGAALSVQPNGLRALRQVGLDQAVVNSGSVIERWLFADQLGDVPRPICAVKR